MVGKILRSILIVVIAVLFASLAVVTGVLYRYFGDFQQSQLKDELHLAMNGVQVAGTDYLQASHTDQHRLTWIASNGDVLYDSHADKGEMENHADREEIREAFATGSGSSVRRSSTLTEQTIYEAGRLPDGSVLRISISRASVASLMVNIFPPILLIASFAVLLSAWLAYRMAKRVVEPLNTLDLEHPLDNDAYEELSPLLHRIENQQRESRLQMETLHRHQEDFAQIIRHMRETLVLLDHTETVISTNPAAEQLFGTDCLQTGTKFPSDLIPDMEQAIKTARENGHFEFRRSIGFRTYQFDISRIESNASVHGLVILAFDVTEQEEAERSRREFSANVSHELKTPLQSIIGSAELLESNLVKAEDIPRFVGHIHREAARLVTLIQDIIRLSQLDEQVELPREEVCLLSLAENVREMLAEIAQSRKVSLTVSGDSGIIIGVRQLLSQLIYNLTDNAIRYNRPGGSVELTVSEDEAGVCLTIRDTGIGIPPEHLEKVFERFYRVDKSHSRQSGGTGLGLSIVKHAVSYHNANLQIESVPGKGTTIVIRF
ncbi:MAG: two-component sensor histidine kinase [Lachnospiraceae bacterium]|nr:two-component sensor histidine kinase [Lachnospiraceae bacterium]